LSSPEGPSLAAALAKKAASDAKAMRRLAGDQEIEDDAVGFHAQQAIEKWLKAVIASRGLEFPKTHDLGRLLEIVANAEVEPPPAADELDRLTIWAVGMRYADPFEMAPLDRARVAEQVEGVGAWAERLLAPAEE
jgi:HEPN domain-containing protein